MFESTATKPTHGPTARDATPESSGLGPLQQVIATEELVLQSIQRLGADFAKYTDALRTWAAGEGEDLEDTFSACTTLLNHWISSLASFADRIASVQECLKVVCTKEEALEEMHRNKESLMSKANGIDKWLDNLGMSPVENNVPQLTGILTCLHEQIRMSDIEIMEEETSLGDVKRDKAKEWMGDLLGGLLECSATGAVVATSGRAIIGCVPSEPTQPGLPRAHYSGHSQVELLVAEAERTIRKISTIGEAGISFVSEADVSFVSEAGDGTQPPNGLPTDDTPGNAPSALDPPTQQTSIPSQPIQPYASSTLPNNQPRNPHELIDFSDLDPYFHPKAYAPGQWTCLSSFDQSPSLPHALSAQPNDPFGDLYDLSNFGEYDSQTYPQTHAPSPLPGRAGFISPIPVLPESSEMPLKGKSKAEELANPLPEHYMSKPDPICGICIEPFQITESPISATIVANSSARLPFGLRLPCPGEHTYCISCLTKYLEKKLDPGGTGDVNTNITVFPIPCPECPPMDWESGIQDDVAEKVFDVKSMNVWHHRKLLDSLPRRYCPNPKCSVLVQIDEDYADPKAQCPVCFQWVCVPCRAMWHKGMTCEKYQSLPSGVRSPEDQPVIDLAKSKRWRRCPGCHAIVERTYGCNHMKCRCSVEFCFNCNSMWDTGGKKCSNNPPCELWDERMLLDPRERERVYYANRRPRAAPARTPAPPPRMPQKRTRKKGTCIIQ